MRSIFVGGTPIVRIRCRDDRGRLAAPSGMTVTVTCPAGSVTNTFSLSDTTCEGLGVYRCPAFTCPDPGTWRVGVVTTGVADVGYSTFDVLPVP